MPKRHWLMKSEPDAYSIDDLARDGVTPWEGVRNYQARNLLRDEIHMGDGVLFYHSSTQPPGVVGLAEVVRESYPDRTAFDPGSPYFDPKSTPDAPRWFVVDVKLVERFPAMVPLSVLQATPGLEDMPVTKKGMRLSVQPVTSAQWDIVVALGRASTSSTPPATRSPGPEQSARKSAAGTRASAKSPGAKSAGAKPASAKSAGAKSAGAKSTEAKPASAQRATPGSTGTKVAPRGRMPGGSGRSPARRR